MNLGPQTRLRTETLPRKRLVQQCPSGTSVPVNWAQERISASDHLGTIVAPVNVARHLTGADAARNKQRAQRANRIAVRPLGADEVQRRHHEQHPVVVNREVARGRLKRGPVARASTKRRVRHRSLSRLCAEARGVLRCTPELRNREPLFRRVAPRRARDRRSILEGEGWASLSVASYSLAAMAARHHAAVRSRLYGPPTWCRPRPSAILMPGRGGAGIGDAGTCGLHS